MGIILKRNRDGSSIRPMWYMRYKADGRTVDKQTPVQVAGTPPPSMNLSDVGDRPFETSRARAQAYFEDFQKKRKIKGVSLEMTRTLIREQTGREIEEVRLDELYERWKRFSRNRQVSETREKLTESAFRRFVNFMKKSSNPADRKCEYLYGVTPDAATRYIDSLKGNLATATVKDHLTLLSGTFQRLLPPGAQNPFADIHAGNGSADEGKIHRNPLTDDELARLYEVAKASRYGYLYPITVCAANTGLRIGDVCLLKWKDVYLQEGHISTTTGKTHTLVHIPIFPELQGILEERLEEKREDDVYVFPEAANCYLYNHSGLIRRGKDLFAEALFGDKFTEQEPVEVINGEPKQPLTEAQVLDAIDRSRFIAKKKSLSKEVYSRYLHGQTSTQIARELNILKSRVSTLLKNIEELTGETIRPWAKADLHSKRLALTRKSHTICQHASSVYGWHTLRANFCVQAIFNKIPEALICQIVGHSTFKTTQNYLNPTWEVFRERWEQSKRQIAPAPVLQPTTRNNLASEQAAALATLCKSLTPEQASVFQKIFAIMAPPTAAPVNTLLQSAPTT